MTEHPSHTTLYSSLSLVQTLCLSSGIKEKGGWGQQAHGTWPKLINRLHTRFVVCTNDVVALLSFVLGQICGSDHWHCNFSAASAKPWPSCCLLSKKMCTSNRKEQVYQLELDLQVEIEVWNLTILNERSHPKGRDLISSSKESPSHPYASGGTKRGGRGVQRGPKMQFCQDVKKSVVVVGVQWWWTRQDFALGQRMQICFFVPHQWHKSRYACVQKSGAGIVCSTGNGGVIHRWLVSLPPRSIESLPASGLARLIRRSKGRWQRPEK